MCVWCLHFTRKFPSIRCLFSIPNALGNLYRGPLTNVSAPNTTNAFVLWIFKYLQIGLKDCLSQGTGHHFCGKLGHNSTRGPGPQVPGAGEQVNQSPICAQCWPHCPCHWGWEAAEARWARSRVAELSLRWPDGRELPAGHENGQPRHGHFLLEFALRYQGAR